MRRYNTVFCPQCRAEGTRLQKLTTSLSNRITELVNENKLKRRIIRDTLEDNERLTKMMEKKGA